MDVFSLKIAAAGLIFLTGLTGGLLPLRFGATEASARWLNIGNGFSGGIFLGAGLIHMLADAHANFASLGGDYPYAAVVAGLGFLLILMLEMVVLRGREDVGEMTSGESMRPFLLTFVLSVHSIIAGIALGLEGSLAASVAILTAIVTHKGSAAFALGVSLKSARFAPRRLVTIIAFFSCMTPLGLAIGTVFSQMVTGPTVVRLEAVFDALAAGTFVYVAVLDIIREAFAEEADLWPKFAALTLGFAGMALLAVWT